MGWVYTVALNLARRKLRRRAMERRLLLKFHPRTELPPESGFELWDLVRTLPPRERTAVVLRYGADLREADVAKAMGISAGTVAKTLNVARSRLGLALEKLYVPERSEVTDLHDLKHDIARYELEPLPVQKVIELARQRQRHKVTRRIAAAVLIIVVVVASVLVLGRPSSGPRLTQPPDQTYEGTASVAFVSKSGFIYVADQSSNSLLELDPSATPPFSVVATIPLTFTPGVVAVSSDGAMAYVSPLVPEFAGGSNTLYEIDLATHGASSGRSLTRLSLSGISHLLLTGRLRTPGAPTSSPSSSRRDASFRRSLGRNSPTPTSRSLPTGGPPSPPAKDPLPVFSCSI